MTHALAYNVTIWPCIASTRPQRRKPGIPGRDGLTGEGPVRERPVLHLLPHPSFPKDYKTQAASAGTCGSKNHQGSSVYRRSNHGGMVVEFSFLTRSGLFTQNILKKVEENSERETNAIKAHQRLEQVASRQHSLWFIQFIQTIYLYIIKHTWSRCLRASTLHTMLKVQCVILDLWFLYW